MNWIAKKGFFVTPKNLKAKLISKFWKANVVNRGGLRLAKLGLSRSFASTPILKIVNSSNINSPESANNTPLKPSEPTSEARETVFYKIDEQRDKQLKKHLRTIFISLQSVPVFMTWFLYYAITWKYYSTVVLPIEFTTVALTVWKINALANELVSYVKVKEVEGKEEVRYKVLWKKEQVAQKMSYVCQERDRVTVKVDNKYLTLFRKYINDEKLVVRLFGIKDGLVSQDPLDKATLFKIISHYNHSRAKSKKSENPQVEQAQQATK